MRNVVREKWHRHAIELEQLAPVNIYMHHLSICSMYMLNNIDCVLGVASAPYLAPPPVVAQPPPVAFNPPPFGHCFFLSFIV